MIRVRLAYHVHSPSIAALHSPNLIDLSTQSVGAWLVEERGWLKAGRQ
jgi:hypothetical protein